MTGHVVSAVSGLSAGITAGFVVAWAFRKRIMAAIVHRGIKPEQEEAVVGPRDR